MEDSFALRLERVEERIEAACRRAGRKRREIELMAVTKFHPFEKAGEALKAGIRLFGENRVREGIEKFSLLWEKYPRDSAKIHLIGSLQRNKAKAAAAFFDCVQSVDRESLVDELGALTAGRETPLMILLEYHTGEDSKAGFPDTDSLCRAAEKALSFRGLMISGLMTMAPFSSDEQAVRSSFRKLAAARDVLEKRFPSGSGKNPSGNAGLSWSCLSMGMTNDFETAIEEGSTLIRVGTALFGER